MRNKTFALSSREVIRTWAADAKSDLISPVIIPPAETDERDFVDPPKLKSELDKYESSKRWLARMMGADPESFTQKDIDESIEYLLPSHLWGKDARPCMKDPREQLQPFLKPIMFDKTNRPKSSAFYTRMPMFFDVLFEIEMKRERLNMPPKMDFLSSPGRNESGQDEKEDYESSLVALPEKMRWVNQRELEQIINEPLTAQQYNLILFRLKRLSRHERADEAQDILLKFQVSSQSDKAVIEETDYFVTEDFARAIGSRKTSTADVLVREGCGVISVNSKPFLDYFSTRTDREQIMHPLVVTGTLGRFDIEINVHKGGTSGQAGAARLALTRAIAAFCPELFQALNDSNMLIHDGRRKERKKPGLKRARKRPTYKRR